MSEVRTILLNHSEYGIIAVNPARIIWVRPNEDPKDPEVRARVYTTMSAFNVHEPMGIIRKRMGRVYED